jgi:alkaline phosphatase
MLAGAIKKSRVLKATGAAVIVGGLVFGLTIGGAFSSSQADAVSTAKAPKKVKNVIVMISDGCGYNHIAATDYFMGKKQAYERFPVSVGMSTYEYEDTAAKIVYNTTRNLLGYDPLLMWKDFTYSAFPLSTDSASAATAMASGIKTYNGAIGVDVTGAPVELVSQRAEMVGKATGVVTTVEWSHATPAGFVAHNVSRNNYAAIAQEMIESSATDVIMGAGNPEFDDNGVPTAKDAKYVGGASLWDGLKAGTAGGDANGDGIADPWKLIQTKDEFEDLVNAKVTPKRLCGTAEVYSTLQQSRIGDGTAAPYAVALNSSVPTLSTMTLGAINVLDADRDGFFLMVEGGAIDWAAHANQTGRMIEEEIDFNQAVDSVIKWVERHSSWDETLLIVTGDHETGNLWGPGSGVVNGVARYAPVVNNGRGKVPGVSWNSPEHTNQLIPLYAKGDASSLIRPFLTGDDPVRGDYLDNTSIADVIFAAMR